MGGGPLASVLDNVSWLFQPSNGHALAANASRPWSLRTANNYERYEVRHGDVYPSSDTGNYHERSEVIGGPDSGYNVDWWISMAQRIPSVSSPPDQRGLPLTALASAITSTQTTIPVVAGINPGGGIGAEIITVDNEQMLVTGGANTTSMTVTRGYNSTTPAIHWPGATVWSDSFMVIGQMHAPPADTAGSPPWNQELYTDGSFAVVLRGGNELSPTVTLPYTLGTYPYDVWNRFVYRLQFDNSGNALGQMDMYVNGTEVFSYASNGPVNMGYTGDGIGPYFKRGIYRSTTLGTAIVEYGNVEFGLNSLLSRVTNPLPLP